MKQFLISSPEWRTKKEIESKLAPYNDVVEEVDIKKSKIAVRT